MTCASRANATSPRTPHAPRASASALWFSSRRSAGNARASRGSTPASTSRRSWLGSRSGLRGGEPAADCASASEVHASQNARIAHPSARACDHDTPRTVAGAASPPSLVSRTAHSRPSFSQHRMCRGRKRVEGVTLSRADGGPARCRSSSVVAGSSRTSNATPAWGCSRSTSSSTVAPRLARTRALPASAGNFTSAAAREARTASGSSRRSKPNAQYTTSPRMHRAESRGESRRRDETGREGRSSSFPRASSERAGRTTSTRRVSAARARHPPMVARSATRARVDCESRARNPSPRRERRFARDKKNTRRDYSTYSSRANKRRFFNCQTRAARLTASPSPSSWTSRASP